MPKYIHRYTQGIRNSPLVTLVGEDSKKSLPSKSFPHCVEVVCPMNALINPAKFPLGEKKSGKVGKIIPLFS